MRKSRRQQKRILHFAGKAQTAHFPHFRAKCTKWGKSLKGTQKGIQKKGSKWAHFWDAFLRPFSFLPYTTMGKAKRRKKGLKRYSKKELILSPFSVLVLTLHTLCESEKSALFTLLWNAQKRIILLLAHSYLFLCLRIFRCA